MMVAVGILVVLLVPLTAVYLIWRRTKWELPVKVGFSLLLILTWVVVMFADLGLT